MADIPSRRTPGELVVKLITVHIVAAGTYAFLSKLQRRSLRGALGATRMLVFILAPTLVLLEFIVNLCRALVNFIRDEADDEDTSFWFYLSAALGMHALQPKVDENEVGKDRSREIPLLELSCAKCEKEEMRTEWTWIGKVLICTFTLVQGLGTIIVYVQRLENFHEAFTMDDRNGMMGVTVLVMSLGSLVVLLSNYKWTLNQPLPPTQTSTRRNQEHSLTCLALAALIIQDFTRGRNYGSYVGHNPMIFIYFILWKLARSGKWHLSSSILFVMLAVIIILFRQDLIERFKQTSAIKLLTKYWVRPRTYARVKVLFHMCLVLLMVADVIVKLMDDIVQVVHESALNKLNSDLWEQVPLSEAIPVL